MKFVKRELYNGIYFTTLGMVYRRAANCTNHVVVVNLFRKKALYFRQISEKFVHQEIANELNTSRVVISCLEKEGFLCLNRHQIILQ